MDFQALSASILVTYHADFPGDEEFVVHRVVGQIPSEAARADRTRPTGALFGFVYDPPYQSTLDAVYVYAGPWSEFPLLPSCM